MLANNKVKLNGNIDTKDADSIKTAAGGGERAYVAWKVV
jgi:hypothetical protein